MGATVSHTGLTKVPQGYLSVVVATFVVTDIVIRPIIGALPDAVIVAYVMVGFVIRLMVGFVVGLMAGPIIGTVTPAFAAARSTTGTAVAAVAATTTAAATVTAAATATAMTSATAATAAAMTSATAAAATAMTSATATAAAMTTATTTAASVTAATTATILGIRTGIRVDGVREQNRRCRKHPADRQSQQAFCEHDEPPLGVARGALRSP